MCSSATSSRNVPSAHKFGNQEEQSNLTNSDLPECPFSDDPVTDNVVEDPISLDHPPIVIDPSETSSVSTCM